MSKRTKLIAVGATVMALAAAGGGVAIAANGGGDHEGGGGPITGTAFDQASAAALDATGGGTVTETEVGDEDSYYEVEVSLGNGDQVDVQLDRGFNVVGEKTEAGEQADNESEQD